MGKSKLLFTTESCVTGCHNQIPQCVVSPTEMCFLTTLQGGSSGSRCWLFGCLKGLSSCPKEPALSTHSGVSPFPPESQVKGTISRHSHIGGLGLLLIRINFEVYDSTTL